MDDLARKRRFGDGLPNPFTPVVLALLQGQICFQGSRRKANYLKRRQSGLADSSLFETLFWSRTIQHPTTHLMNYLGRGLPSAKLTWLVDVRSSPERTSVFLPHSAGMVSFKSSLSEIYCDSKAPKLNITVLTHPVDKVGPKWRASFVFTIFYICCRRCCCYRSIIKRSLVALMASLLFAHDDVPPMSYVSL